MLSRLIIVANRLPVSAHQTAQGVQFQPSPGGMAAALRSVAQDPNTLWLGYPGIDIRIDENNATSGLPSNAIPLYIPKDEYKDYYSEVANGSMWPVLHGFKPRKIYTPQQWQTFLAVTERFAERLLQIITPEDQIWIHDYHLCMLPQILRNHGVRNKIGFFLHTPFAPPERLQYLPNHRDILESLQMTDVCGLHTERDVHNMQQALQAFDIEPSNTFIHAFPVGIDDKSYVDVATLPEVRQHVQEIRHKYPDKTLIYSVSRLDYTKGLLEQLEAVEQLLHRLKEPQQIVYQLTVAPSREDIEEYADLRGKIDQLVKEINSRWATADWQPIEYAYRNFPFEETTAWYLCADIMLVAPLMDGMNLIAKEYIAAHAQDSGALVLSKFAGAAEQMKHAFLCDPHDVASITSALVAAFETTPQQKRATHRLLWQGVVAQNAAWWAATFLKALNEPPILHDGVKLATSTQDT